MEHVTKNELRFLLFQRNKKGVNMKPNKRYKKSYNKLKTTSELNRCVANYTDSVLNLFKYHSRSSDIWKKDFKKWLSKAKNDSSFRNYVLKYYKQRCFYEIQ